MGSLQVYGDSMGFKQKNVAGSGGLTGFPSGSIGVSGLDLRLRKTEDFMKLFSRQSLSFDVRMTRMPRMAPGLKNL